MAERANPETLQPSLLDRLTDNAPDKSVETAEHATMNLRQLRQVVMRDLAWLLNTGNLASLIDLDEYPEVCDSVLNYGMPDLAGTLVSSLKMRSLERLLSKAVRRFEPRIDADTLKVTVNVQPDHMNRSALVLDIEGSLWAYPSPMRLHLKTELDLETGEVAVRDASGRN